MAVEPFAPTRWNKDDEDITFAPNQIDDTVKGGSALPGSAVNPKTGVQAPWQAQGFVGTRTSPGGEG